jgi:tetratricopeptide (TPR) repeat protein
MAGLPEIDSLWDFSDPAGSEARFREALPRFEESGDRTLIAELLTQMARSQGLQRNFDEAHETLNRVETMLTGEMKRVRVRFLLERGRVFNSSKNPDKAKPLFIEAVELGKAAKEDVLTVDALHMVAIVSAPEDSMAWNLKALALAEKSDDPRARKWQGSLYNNMGWTYHDEGKYVEALDLFEKGLAFRREQGDPVTIMIARWTVARCLRSLGRLDEALAIQRDLEKVGKNLGSEDGFTLEELAEILLLQGKDDEAREYFAKAYAKLTTDEWLRDSEPERLERLKKLGGV